MTGEEFKKIRLQLGYTQKELGNILGYSDRSVIGWERDTHKIERSICLLMLFMSQASKRMLKEILATDL